MNWMRLIAIILGAGVVSSFTDWFFAGDWIHRRFTYPEIWRHGSEAKAIALTSPLPFLTCRVFADAASRLGDSLCSGCTGICWCGVDDRPTTAHPHQCRIYEAAPRVCGILRNGLAHQALHCWRRGGMVLSLTAISVPRSDVELPFVRLVGTIGPEAAAHKSRRAFWRKLQGWNRSFPEAWNHPH